jgi:DNA-binding response OmpR family regulator
VCKRRDVIDSRRRRVLYARRSLVRGSDFEFDSDDGRDPACGETVHRLEPQPAALLALLMSRPGELVTRQEVIASLSLVAILRSLHDRFF